MGKGDLWSFMSQDKEGINLENGAYREGEMDNFGSKVYPIPKYYNGIYAKVKLMEVGIYLDFKCDESYTPNKISFRIGGNISDLREYVCLDLKEPVGWFIVPFKTIQSNGVEKLNINPILFPHFNKTHKIPQIYFSQRIHQHNEYLNLHPLEPTQWERHPCQTGESFRSQRTRK
jgi:hypothetical protein